MYQTQYLHRVDHLRLFAASLVLFYHSFHRFHLNYTTDRAWPTPANPFFSAIVEGHTGVALFFVLSGFLFCIICNGRKMDYRGFMHNRVLRIYPLYVFTLLLTSCLMMKFDVASFLATLLPFNNLSGRMSHPELLDHTWSIAVEFQFYLILPFLIRFMKEDGWQFLAKLWGLSLLVKLIFFLASPPIHNFAYYTIFGRLEQFIIGMLIGLLYLRKSKFQFRWYHAVLGLGAVLGVLKLFNQWGGLLQQNQSSIWVTWPSIEGIAWGSLILTYCKAKENLFGSLSGAVAQLGEISYSIYMFHVVILQLFIKLGLYRTFTDSFELNAFLNTLLFVFPATLLVSALTYSVIEKPFLRLKRAYLH